MQGTDSSKETGADAGAGGGQRTASSGAGSGAGGVDEAHRKEVKQEIGQVMNREFDRWYATTVPKLFRSEFVEQATRTAFFNGAAFGYGLGCARSDRPADPASA